MLDGGEWVAESDSEGIAGFHLSELYSQWRTWREMVLDFLESKQDSEMLQVFVNTSLGETFDEPGKGVEPTGLAARCEPYPAQVPDPVLVLIASVDTQDDRLEVEISGYSHGQEKWGISYRILYGDPAEDDVWTMLDDILLRETFKHESGTDFRIASTCIDSGGHHTQRVYDYCKARSGQRIFAIKGVGGFGRPMVSSPSRKRHGRNKRQVDLFTLGVDEIKTLVHSRLHIEKPGPGYWHFPISDEYDSEYFDQLSSEKVQVKMKMGVPIRAWIQVRPRNESFDTAVYNHAALLLLNPNFNALAERMDEAAAQDKSETKPATQRAPGRRRGGFANAWR